MTADQDSSPRERTREELLSLVLETAHEAFISMGQDGTITEWNPEAERTFGWSRSEAIGREVAETIIPVRFREAHRKGLQHFLATGDGPVLDQRIEVTAVDRDGREFPAEMTIAAVPVAGGHAFNAFLHEISERKQLESYVAAQNAVNAVLVRSVPVAEAIPALLEALGTSFGWELGTFWRADEDANVIRCEHVWREPGLVADGFTELSKKTDLPPGVGLPGRVWESGEPSWVENVVDDANFPRADCAAQAGLHAAVCLPLKGDGRVVAVIEFFCSELRRPNTELLLLYTQMIDHVGLFLERKRVEAKLAYQAMHDPLTGLPNRNLLLDRMQHSLELSKRLTSTLAVLFLNIDNFKVVNDSHGHQAGDDLLEQVASRLRSMLRASDTTSKLGSETVARLGGDEFVVLCEAVQTERDGVRVAERLKQGLAAPFTIAGHELSVSVSIGITFPSGTHADAESLLRDADVAMYRAKDEGGNRYEIFNERMRTRVMERLSIENDLRAAVERDELVLHYQPIVAASDESVVGVEALLRWQHPERGLVTPGEIIPLAEETGLIVPIGAWVLHEACRQVTRWDEAHPGWPPLRVSVNVSGRQLSKGFMETVTAVLDETGIDPTRLMLEITESVVVENPESAQLVKALGELGIHLALDDFGTGYSSLGYLTRFDLNVLKIDRSLISVMDENPQSCMVTAAAIEMGQALKMNVVGEGVETPFQLERLRALGCDLVQGYLFARPMPAEETTGFLTECFEKVTPVR